VGEREPRPGAEIRAGDGDPRHGTLNGYCNLKCNCDDCRRRWSDYTTTAKKERVPPPPGDERHGRYTTYGNWNCRCDLCTYAHSSLNTLWRERRRAKGGR
jgi:hypothetical protein